MRPRDGVHIYIYIYISLVVCFQIDTEPSGGLSRLMGVSRLDRHEKMTG